jgi:hypothetical protein
VTVSTSRSKFKESAELVVGGRDKAPSIVAMGINDPNRLPLTING